MPSTLESARRARFCVEGRVKESDKPVMWVNHSGKKDGTAERAQAYFQKAQCPEAFVSKVLKKDGSWNGRYRFPSDIFSDSLSLEELDSKLDAAFYSIYSGANGSLDHIYTDGFNRHDPIHIEKVKRGTKYLVDLADASLLVKKRSLICAGGHDVGNPWSRQVHSLVSPLIMQRVLPSLLSPEHRGDWRIIRRAVQLHNEPIAAALIASWEKDGCKNEEQIIERMATDFGPEALALIIADKTDIGRHRISQKPKDRTAVDNDRHLEVNLLGETAGLSLSDDRKTFTWALRFTPGLAEDEDDRRFEKKEGSNKVYVSKATHKAHQELGVSHFASWQILFWSLYMDRIHLTLRSIFALYPTVETVCIRAEDADAGQQYIQEFTRKNLAENVNKVRIINIPQQKIKRE